MPPMTEHHLDATGLLCPLPVLKVRKRLQPLASGEQLTLQTDDPAAIVDVPHFCNEAGHHVVSQSQQGAATTWVIQKK